MNEYMDILRLSNVVDKKHGYDLYITESAQLSSGQKQRISFVRALLRNPSLLILDEATSNLDHETERIIIENIAKYRKDMTILVISHKNSFDYIADQVFVKGVDW